MWLWDLCIILFGAIYVLMNSLITTSQKTVYRVKKCWTICGLRHLPSFVIGRCMMKKEPFTSLVGMPSNLLVIYNVIYIWCYKIYGIFKLLKRESWHQYYKLQSLNYIINQTWSFFYFTIFSLWGQCL